MQTFASYRQAAVVAAGLLLFIFASADRAAAAVAMPGSQATGSAPLVEFDGSVLRSTSQSEGRFTVVLNGEGNEPIFSASDLTLSMDAVPEADTVVLEQQGDGVGPGDWVSTVFEGDDATYGFHFANSDEEIVLEGNCTDATLTGTLGSSTANVAFSNVAMSPGPAMQIDGETIERISGSPGLRFALDPLASGLSVSAITPGQIPEVNEADLDGFGTAGGDVTTTGELSVIAGEEGTIPEPTSLALLGIGFGLCASGWTRRRHRQT
jgi:hypothetical protein